MTRKVILPILFLIFHCAKAMKNSSNPLILVVEDKLESLFTNYAVEITKWLQHFNDGNFKNSELGRLLRYEEIKPKFSIDDKSRSKKMSMMMPLVFHLGVTSTWLMLTAIMAAKAMAIGVILVIFKVASGSAKLASYFTAWKSQQHHDWSWTPHDHRNTYHADSHSSSPAWSPPLTGEYRTIPEEARNYP